MPVYITEHYLDPAANRTATIGATNHEAYMREIINTTPIFW